VEDGAYTYWVKAYNALGEQLDVDYRVSGMVTGVTFDSGAAQLKLDNWVGSDVGSVVSVLK
jgi:flagellar hook assembly protein FlgD